jgi:hypothetical protein
VSEEPWPYVQSFKGASPEDRDRFRSAGIEAGSWGEADPLPQQWTCGRCGNTFPVDRLLITGNVEKPRPSCPFKPTEGQICSGDGWATVHPSG